MELFFILGGGFLMLLLLGARSGGGERAAAAAGAQRVRGKLDEVFGGEHEYAPARAADFPEADHGYYQAATSELTQRGFAALGDLEDLTLSRAYPSLRTYARVFVDQGQLIRGGVFHMRTRGVLVGMLQVIRATPRHLRLVEMITESSTGHVLITTNTGGLDRLDPPPGFAVERMEPSRRPGAVAERHTERLRAWLREHPSYQPIAMATLEDAIASMQRINVQLALYRAAKGGLSRDELERIKGGPLSPLDEEFLAHLNVPHSKPAPD